MRNSLQTFFYLFVFSSPDRVIEPPPFFHLYFSLPRTPPIKINLSSFLLFLYTKFNIHLQLLPLKDHCLSFLSISLSQSILLPSEFNKSPICYSLSFPCIKFTFIYTFSIFFAKGTDSSLFPSIFSSFCFYFSTIFFLCTSFRP